MAGGDARLEAREAETGDEVVQIALGRAAVTRAEMTPTVSESPLGKTQP